MEILSIVEREAAQHGAGKVLSIRLRIGDLSGVESSSLAFCFDAVKGENPITRETSLLIDRVPVKVRCVPCDAQFTGEGPLLTCPACHGFNTRLLQGDEMTVAEIEVE